MRPFFLISFSFISTFSFSQKFLISNPRGNLMYKQWSNPLSVLVTGYSCDSIFLKTDNGHLKKHGCNYLYYPDSAADSKIEVYVIKNSKKVKVGQNIMRVRNISIPEAVVGGIRGGEINKKSFQAQMGVDNYYTELAIDLKFVIKSFSIIIIRDKEIVFHQFNEGNIFNSEVIAAFRLLFNNDRVLIANILAYGPDYKDQYLKPLEFTMVDNK
jgi:hypothetical protein